MPARMINENIKPLLVLLSVKKPVKVIMTFKRYTEPLQVMPAMKDTGITNTLFSFLLAIGLLVDYFL